MKQIIISAILFAAAGLAHAQINKYVEARDYGYALDEKVLAEVSTSPVACDPNASTSGALDYTALYCENAKGDDLRIGIEWKRTSLKIEPYAKHLGGTLLKEIGSVNEGNIRWDVVKTFTAIAGIKGTLFDCTVTDDSKKYFLSFFLFSSKEDGQRQIVYVFSKTPDSQEADTSVKTAARKIAQTIQPHAK